MDHAVTDAVNWRALQQRGPYGQDLARGSVMVETFGWKGAIFDDRTIGVGDRQTRRNSNSLDLPPEEADLLPSRFIKRELDAGRPGVDYSDAKRHRAPL